MLARSFLPEAALNIRRYVEDQWTVGRQPFCEEIDLDPLPRLSGADMADALAAVSDEEWRDVQERITPHLPPEDPGSVLPHERRALYALMRWRLPDRPLEIGTHLGVSAAYLAAGILKPNTSLTTVDIAPTPAATSMIHQLGRTNRIGKVVFMRSDSLAFLNSPGPRFDFAFLDGNHRAGRVYREIVALLPRLAPDALVVLHDVNPGGLPLTRQKVLRGPWLAGERLRREYGIKTVPVTGSLAVLSR